MISTRRLAAFSLCLSIAACSGSPGDRPPAPRAQLTPTSSAPDVWLDAPPAVSAMASDTPAPPDPPTPSTGRDFAEEVKLLFRVVACAGEAPIPASLDAATLKAHCAELSPKIEAYRARYVARARPFLTGLLPEKLPRTVVYPFGGGDLATALTTYPDAREITAISLELPGDPRRIRGMGKEALDRSLKRVRAELSELLLSEEYSRSETLKRTQRGDIPGELCFFLVGLAVHGMEPVSLRYFTLTPDGGIHYLTEDEIDAVETTAATHRKSSWTPPDFSEAFANVEIGFRPRGAGPDEPPRIHRHIAANLADDHLASAPALLRHLAKKGHIAAMTKAASYLLWSDAFSSIRGYLLDNVDFMISDSTGIPPAFADKAGLVQETYGSFRSSLLHASREHNAAFHKLWQTGPHRDVPMRYGYLDSAGAPHLLVTRRPPAPAR